MANKKIDAMMTRAKETLSNNERVKKLLESVKDKIDEISQDGEGKQNFIYHLQTIIRMVKAQVTGEYHSFSIQSMLMLVFALVYFITPLDLLPDFIPALGFTDDISIVLFIFRSIKEDIDQFLSWEEAGA
ncbi:YkvA family protein [Marinoscillum sp. MHG1-6]|uniref:YkvA family protein n=1 Tax=Marinoscillum sp. MHG1-6 TaxID=2959627 RepID=UPI002157E0F5|nr:YkvA family protein [Marinoscillum sp. MHG1-6]